MASRKRTQFFRMNFANGIDERIGEYSEPGTLKAMRNMFLDIYNEGSIRQAWGASPVVLEEQHMTGSIMRTDYAGASASIKYPGVCFLDKIAFGGEAGDTIIYGENFQGTTITETRFYHVAELTNTNSRQIIAPFGSTFEFNVPIDSDYYWDYATFFHLKNYPRYTGNITASVTGAPVNGSVVLSPTYLKFTAAGPPGADTFTVLLTDVTSGSTVSYTLVPSAQVGGSNMVNHIYIVAPVAGHAGRNQGFWDTAFQIHDPDIPPQINNKVDGQGGLFFNNYSLTTTLSPVFTQNDQDYDVAFEGTGSITQIQILGQSSKLENNPLTGTAATLKWAAASTINIYVYMPKTGHIDETSSHLAGALSLGLEMKRWAAPRTEIHSQQGTGSLTGPLGVWRHASLNGSAYFFDGESTPWTCDLEDPTSTGTIGLARPDISGATVSINGAAATTSLHIEGIVRYAMAALDDDGLEGPLSDWFPGRGSSGTTGAYGFDAGTGSELIVDNMPITDTGSRKMRLYRTMKNRAQPFFLTDLDDVGGTLSVLTYTDSIPDLDLGDLPWLHGDPPPPDAFSPIAFADRMWVLGTRPGVAGARRTTLFWSDLNEPESWWYDGNWANIFADDGDEATCIVRDPSGILAFKNDHMYRMVGRDPIDISFVEVTSSDNGTGIGTPGVLSAISTEFGTFFYWNRGVYIYQQGFAFKISDPISETLERNTSLLSASSAQESEVQVSYDPVTKLLFVVIPNANRTHVYDVDRKRWIGNWERQVGFLRRMSMKLYSRWDNATGTSSTVHDSLFCNDMDAYTNVNNPGYVLQINPFSPYVANNIPNPASYETYPLLGNAGPYRAKRFLYVDWVIKRLSSDAHADGLFSQKVSAGTLTVAAQMDGTTNTGTSASFGVMSVATQAKRDRHALGMVAGEMELSGFIEGPNVVSIFEYGTSWVSVGRDSAFGGSNVWQGI